MIGFSSHCKLCSYLRNFMAYLLYLTNCFFSVTYFSLTSCHLFMTYLFSLTSCYLFMTYLGFFLCNIWPRFYLFIFIVTLQDSILDIKMPVFSGNGPPQIKSYMDSFPFPFYVILRDINSLPNTLGDALRQWFELVTSQSWFNRCFSVSCHYITVLCSLYQLLTSKDYIIPVTHFTLCMYIRYISNSLYMYFVIFYHLFTLL